MRQLAESKKEVTGQQKEKSLISLQNISQRITPVGENKYELSEYIPGEASAETIIWMLKKLKGIFPETSKEAFDTIAEMIKTENWSDERVKDAVKSCIMKHSYPRISPADILSFDKRRRIYTREELQILFHRDYGSEYGQWGKYEEIKIPYEPKRKHELYPDKDAPPPEPVFHRLYVKKPGLDFLSNEKTLSIRDRQAFN